MERHKGQGRRHGGAGSPTGGQVTGLRCGTCRGWGDRWCQPRDEVTGEPEDLLWASKPKRAPNAAGGQANPAFSGWSESWEEPTGELIGERSSACDRGATSCARRQQRQDP